MGSYDDFDMEAYIDSRMLGITDPGERVLYKEIVGNLLKELYRYHETAFRELNERILAEEKGEQGDCAVHIALTDRKHYDSTDTFLYPMQEEDVRKKEIRCDDVRKALERGEELRLFTAFFQTTVTALHGIPDGGRKFCGVIKTENREYRGTFVVRRNETYLRKIGKLYEIFAANFKPWTTVCAAYLRKLYDVFPVFVEDIGKEEEIREIRVDFEEYAGVVSCDVFPLWNLKEITEKTSIYPEPAFDKIHYEHQIFAHRLERGCQYLVMNQEEEITNIRRRNGDLLITCPQERPIEWSLYQVNREAGTGRYLFPVLSNQCRESFSGSITELYRRSIKTKAEMARLMESFPVGNCLVFRGYRIAEEVPEGCEACNYNMDDFVRDEIRAGVRPQVLVISFSPEEPQYYLNEDIMSFLVTQVQWMFPEYRCVGELV